MTYFTKGLQRRRAIRDEKRRQSGPAYEHLSLLPGEIKPVMCFHAALLVGIWEPYLYPSLVPLMLLTTRVAYRMPGFEAQARDAFNMTWLYSVAFACISIVTLLVGTATSPTEITEWHLPLIAIYVVLIVRALVCVKTYGAHHYLVPAHPLRARYSEGDFLGHKD